MKKIFKTSVFAILLLALASCTEADTDPTISNGGILLKQPIAGTEYTLAPQDASDDLLTLEWDAANYGMPSVSSYTIEIAKSGTNFATPIPAVISTEAAPTSNYTWSVGYLNSLVNTIGFAPCESVDIDIRIKSSLGLNPEKVFIQYSNIVTIKVNPYSLNLPLLSFASNVADAATAPKLASSGVLNTDFEGYMWLEPGSYKFYQPDACGSFANPVVYGDDDNGSFNTLVVDGSGYQVNTAGYFLVRADLTTNIYSVRPTTWNLYGGAKTIFPGANSAMVYNQASGLWTLSISLGQGYGFKFRSNGNAFILGAYNANSTGLLFSGSDMSYVALPLANPEPPYVFELKTDTTQPSPRVNNNYTVTLDLRSPRNYKYSVTAN